MSSSKSGSKSAVRPSPKPKVATKKSRLTGPDGKFELSGVAHYSSAPRREKNHQEGITPKELVKKAGAAAGKAALVTAITVGALVGFEKAYDLIHQNDAPQEEFKFPADFSFPDGFDIPEEWEGKFEMPAPEGSVLMENSKGQLTPTMPEGHGQKVTSAGK